MARMNSLKMAAVFVITISVLASAGTASVARQLECSYDYVTHAEVQTISETGNEFGDLEYRFHHEFGSGGLNLWRMRRGNQLPMKSEQRGSLPYSKISGDLYAQGHGTFAVIFYINFERAVLYEAYNFGPALNAAEQFPLGYKKSERLLNVPVKIWDCRRLD